MDQIEHSHRARNKKNSAKTNVTLSVIIHAVIFLIGALWAAHQGMLGDKLKTITASILDKEKKEVAKKEEPKEETKKVDQPKVADVVKASAAPAPPPAFVPPTAAGVAAPPPVTFGGDNFGLSQEALSGNPVTQYKQSVESTLRSRWDRPTDIDDANFVAEVEVAVDSTGKILSNEMKKSSGDKRWDDSVRKVFASTKALSRPPPAGFPEKVLVRFDVEASKTEPLLQSGAQ